MKFEQIYQDYKNLVFNLALQYLNNVEDAEEITQDVFVKIHEKISTFKHESNLKTWIYRITINQSLDYLKAKQRQKRSFLFNIFRINDDENPIEIPNFNHPGVELEQKEAIQRIFNCIHKLPENQKTVIILLKIEQLSQDQAAEIMEISSKAVESLFQRAKKKLEELLKDSKEIE